MRHRQTQRSRSYRDACVVEEELIDDLDGEAHTVAVLFTLWTGGVQTVIWALSLLTWRTDPVTTAQVTAWAACAEAISKADGVMATVSPLTSSSSTSKK